MSQSGLIHLCKSTEAPPTPISTTYTLKVLHLQEVVIELSTACYFAEMAGPRIVVH